MGMKDYGKQDKQMIYLSPELYIRRHTQLLALGGASVPEFDDHLTKQDTPSVHVWHRNHIGW